MSGTLLYTLYMWYLFHEINKQTSISDPSIRYGTSWTVTRNASAIARLLHQTSELQIRKFYSWSITPNPNAKFCKYLGAYESVIPDDYFCMLCKDCFVYTEVILFCNYFRSAGIMIIGIPKWILYDNKLDFGASDWEITSLLRHSPVMTFLTHTIFEQ